MLKRYKNRFNILSIENTTLHEELHRDLFLRENKSHKYNSENMSTSNCRNENKK